MQLIGHHTVGQAGHRERRGRGLVMTSPIRDVTVTSEQCKLIKDAIGFELFKNHSSFGVGSGLVCAQKDEDQC